MTDLLDSQLLKYLDSSHTSTLPISSVRHRRHFLVSRSLALLIEDDAGVHSETKRFPLETRLVAKLRANLNASVTQAAIHASFAKSALANKVKSSFLVSVVLELDSRCCRNKTLQNIRRFTF